MNPLGQNKRKVVITDIDGNPTGPLPLVPYAYDYVSCSYSNGLVTSVVYKSGGASGTTVATLTITYSGTDIATVTRT